MTHSEHSCSGFDGADLDLDEEVRNILDAVFCSCHEDAQDDEARLRRDLYRLTELGGRTPVEAARRLGLEVSQAQEWLAKTRRDIAVVQALGLFRPQAGEAKEAEDAPRSRNCRC